MTTLEGRVALVTGAARGLGKSAALQLRCRGAHVVATDLDEAGLAALKADCADAGAALEIAPCDVSDRDQVRAMVAHWEDRFGQIDILVNNASWASYAPIEDVTPDVVNRMFNVGLAAMLWTIQGAVPAMKRGRGGSIINMSSIAAEIGIHNAAVYSIVKGGVASLTRQLAIDLAPFGISVNSVAPGPVPTEGSLGIVPQEGWEKRRRATPAGRLGTPEEVANLVAFLGDPENRFITGEMIRIDGGLSRSMT
ncbi:SDR family NAD(P)-dependent oxidoreductase [Roseovarius sp.]|uniref:SDR family NAD(P)-dependent oxidoreductase n=1 Tax=Roseovarius sp. TaxID=1486281 RepID=UPI003A984503